MSRLRTAGAAGPVVLVAAAAAVGGYAVTHSVRAGSPRATPSASIAAPSVLGAASVAPSPAASVSAGVLPAATALASTLAPALAAPGLGTRVRGSVLDVSTGAVLLDRGAAVPAAPASTAKVLTAAALLTVRRPTDRITTTVRAGSDGTVVLVGAGDPTLSGAAKGASTAYPQAARISDLAAQLTAAHVRVSRILVDDSLFTGPVTSPAWDADDVPTSYASAITAVMADGGRAAPADAVRSTTPDLAAGRELAAALGAPKLSVTRGRAVTGSAVLASVRSAPFSVLIEQMLLESDNVIAECLARQVAIAEREPVTFTGSAVAVRKVLAGAGIDPGAGLVDGSGLAASDRVSTAVLSQVLRRVADTGPASLRPIVAGLPVAAWSGTLADRYVVGSARAGAGVVRAKTGTLTGVSAIAGLVHDRSGRLLAFSFVADRAGSTPAAESALDTLVARLAGCGCG